MIDINAVINNAIATAVNEAMIRHLQGMADLINKQDQRITQLDSDLNSLRGTVAAVMRRTSEVEANSTNTSVRVITFENELGQLALRLNTVAMDVKSLEEVNPCIVGRINALSQRTDSINQTSIEAAVEVLNSQEWFWEKLRNFCERTLGDSVTSDLLDKRIEEAFENHVESHGHASQEWVEQLIERVERRIGALGSAMDKDSEKFKDDIRELIVEFCEESSQFEELLNDKLGDSDALSQAVVAAFSNGYLTIGIDKV